MAKPSPRAIRAALEAQEARRELALARLADWPQGMPPLCDTHIGTLVGLEKDGLAQRLPERDPVVGDLRFVLTEAGKQRQLDAR